MPSGKHRLLSARALAEFTSLYYVLACFLPTTPITVYSLLDQSWMQVLHHAFLERWQFGKDIVFTFGPWGFLYGGYHPATHLLSIAIWTVLAVVFWWAGWRVARFFFANEPLAWTWLMLVITVAAAPSINMDVRLTAWVLLLWLVHFFVEARPFSALEAALVAGLSVLSLIKCNLLIVSTVTILAIAADNVIRHRRFPWVLLVFTASSAVCWLLAGQHWSSLGPFVRNSWQIVSGYSEALMLYLPTETRDIWAGVEIMSLLAVLAGYACWKSRAWLGAIPAAAFCFILFTVFKYGYVRHDHHEAEAGLQSLLISLICFAALWPLAKQKGKVALGLNLLAPLIIGLFATVAFSRYSNQGLSRTLAQNFSFRNLTGPVRLLVSRARFQQAYENYIQKLRQDFPLPPIDGSVDAFSWDQGVILAHGLNYRPRPVIHSYSAYTPRLLDLNASFLRSDRAPDNILFKNPVIDRQFPSLEDGLSWPELLTRYDVREVQSAFAVLHRSPNPRSFRLVPLREVAVNFGEAIALPSAGDLAIWAQIEMNQTTLGTLRSFLYKPPMLFISVSRRQNAVVQNRLVPGMARAGFVVSPLIEGGRAFATLACNDKPSNWAENETTSFTITGESHCSVDRYYRTPMRVRLFRLEYPLQEGAQVKGLH